MVPKLGNAWHITKIMHFPSFSRHYTRHSLYKMRTVRRKMPDQCCVCGRGVYLAGRERESEGAQCVLNQLMCVVCASSRRVSSSSSKLQPVQCSPTARISRLSRTRPVLFSKASGGTPRARLASISRRRPRDFLPTSAPSVVGSRPERSRHRPGLKTRNV